MTYHTILLDVLLLSLWYSSSFLPYNAIRASLMLALQHVLIPPWAGRRTQASCKAHQPPLPPDVITEHILVWKPGERGFKMEVLPTASSLTGKWTSVFVTLKAGSICCLIFPLNLSSSSLIRFPATCPHFLFLHAILLWAPAGRHPSFKAVKL